MYQVKVGVAQRVTTDESLSSASLVMQTDLHSLTFPLFPSLSLVNSGGVRMDTGDGRECREADV